MMEFRAQNGIASLYGIRQTDLPTYLYFNVVMIFFRPIGDVFNLSQLELFHGWKVYEYLVYSRYRFLQREMRWKVRRCGGGVHAYTCTFSIKLNCHNYANTYPLHLPVALFTLPLSYSLLYVILAAGYGRLSRRMYRRSST